MQKKRYTNVTNYCIPDKHMYRSVSIQYEINYSF